MLVNCAVHRTIPLVPFGKGNFQHSHYVWTLQNRHRLAAMGPQRPAVFLRLRRGTLAVTRRRYAQIAIANGRDVDALRPGFGCG